jgi:hypothetical protein
MENDLRLKESKGDSSPLRESVLEFQKNIIETAVMSTSGVHKFPYASSLLREPALELKKNIMKNDLRL